MKLSEIKSILDKAESVDFALENGTKVPENLNHLIAPPPAPRVQAAANYLPLT